MTEAINFTPDFGAKENSSSIKVIGVGGGGSNAVQHMYSEGIQGVDYLVCNTDKCHLEACKIQDKLLLGNGLGAGANPEVARNFATGCEEKIKEFIISGGFLAVVPNRYDSKDRSHNGRCAEVAENADTFMPLLYIEIAHVFIAANRVAYPGCA